MMSSGPKFIRRILVAIGILVVLGIFVILIFGFQTNNISPVSVGRINSLNINGVNNSVDSGMLKILGGKYEKNIEIELAQTPAERTRGLSGRKSLAPDHGMLFIFEKSGIYGFWMPDMLFSIDILWIDEEKKIVHIEKNVSPDSYPKIFTPTVAAKYVLEVPAGFSDENKIVVGNTVVF